MPELPEVETVVRTLETQIKDAMICDVNIIYSPIVTDPDFRSRMIGQHFREFKRRGKYLIFVMDDLLFVSHLRMEGKYYLLGASDPVDKHTHVIFKLDDGRELRYHDVRKFGRMELMDIGSDLDDFHELGPEPFSDKLTLEYARNYLLSRKKEIKEVLLDQSFIAGIGNIYADEILFRSGISPVRKANSLSDTEIERIIDSTRIIIAGAIKAGGTTIRSYTSSLGVTGRFQLELKVHTKDKCPCCGHEVVKIRVGGRGTYYCPECQK